MPFLLRIRTTLAVILRMLINRTQHPELVLVGAFATVRWVRTDTVRSGFISFSEEPEDDDAMDVFGITKKETFQYLTGAQDFIRHIWRKHTDGWHIQSGVLLYASVIE